MAETSVPSKVRQRAVLQSDALRPRTKDPVYRPSLASSSQSTQSRKSWGKRTLRTVLDLERLLHPLARSGLVTSRRLNAIHGIDTAAAQPLRVLEIQPLDRALGVVAGARRRGGIRLSQLAQHCLWEGRGELVQSKGGCRSGEEVVADHVLVAEGLQVLGEARWHRGEREG